LKTIFKKKKVMSGRRVPVKEVAFYLSIGQSTVWYYAKICIIPKPEKLGIHLVWI